MLETWEAAVKFVSVSVETADMKPLNIARLLGWTRQRNEEGRVGNDNLKNTASACNAAHALIFPPKPLG